MEQTSRFDRTDGVFDGAVPSFDGELAVDARITNGDPRETDDAAAVETDSVIQDQGVMDNSAVDQAWSTPDLALQYDTGGGSITPCQGSDPYPWNVNSPPGGLDPLPAPLRKVTVTNGAQLSAALSAAKPGDLIELADGTYSGAFKSAKSGTAQAPIAIRATNLLKAKLSSGFRIASNYTVLSGVEAVGVALTVGGKYSRITRCRVRDFTGRRPIAISELSSYIRVDHNEVRNYHQQGISLVTNAGTEPHHVWIDHNWIRDKLPAPAGVNSNLEEAIQMGEGGSSHQAEVFSVVEHNLIENNLDTDDAISLKSGKSIVCGNTLIDAKGGICARGGKGNVIIGNYLKNTMIKVHDANHRVIGNELFGTSNLLLIAGNMSITDTKAPSGCGSGHRPATNVLVAGNTGPMKVGKHYDASCYTYPAKNIVIESHTGTVNLVSGHTQNVTQQPQTAETWASPVMLTSSDVGPLAP